jgi:adenylyltransferase/sulfurtransferase
VAWLYHKSTRTVKQYESLPSEDFTPLTKHSFCTPASATILTPQIPVARDYSRLDSTAFARERVSGLRTLVAGAGALGNEVLKNLGLIGVGHIDVLDRDRVEASNLTRSVLFCTPDIDLHIRDGTAKADLAARRAREINPDVQVSAHVAEIGDVGTGILRRAHVVFSCFDNEMARLELGWMCNRLDIPLVDGGLGMINASSGMVSLFPGARGPCYACRKGADRRRQLLSDLQGHEDPCGTKERLQREAAIVPTTPTMASIVGALQVEVGIRHALDALEADPSEGCAYRISIHPEVRLDSMKFGRSPSCSLHQPESFIHTVIERSDRVSEEWTAGQLLSESGAAFLTFDWPITVRAVCRDCRHEWEPFVRRARFRRAHCPRCCGLDLAETEVLTGVEPGSTWAGRSLTALGLPRGHIHEVIGGESRRVHIEVTGDLPDYRRVNAC